MSAPSRSEYRIGIICALPKETAAVAAVLEEEYPSLGTVIAGGDDRNPYILGRIYQHHVVIACLPAGIFGTIAAATVVTHMVRTFKNIRIGLMVGIGGGIPSPTNNIRLGDVVISQPHGAWPGVVQYDMGKRLGDGKFERTGSLDKPPTSLLTALSHLQALHCRSSSQVSAYITEALESNPVLADKGYGFPGTHKDCLHCAYCNSPKWWWRWWLLLWWLCALWRCETCTNGRVPRNRQNEDPKFHYGTIASANLLVKDATLRDQLGEEFNAKCVEMEAAGLMNDFPCLVIRGICDYADRYKNDDWQEYAALAAAALAKELLHHVVPENVQQERLLAEAECILKDQLDLSKGLLKETKQQNKQADTRYTNEKYQECIRFFNTSRYQEFKNRNPLRASNTCKWALGDEKFNRWSESVTNDLLWISADPGCGKSVLARSLTDTELRRNGNTVCYFFFKDNEMQDNLSTALCAVLHQLFIQESGLVEHAMQFWEKNRSNADVDALWDILLTTVRSSPGLNLTCVFDALDECQDTDRARLIRLLTNFYEQSSRKASGSQCGRLKFLVTSRPYSDIQEQFYLPDHLPSIRLRGEDESEQIRQEINTVIKLRVQELAVRLGLDDRVKSRLEDRLLKMEHRTYLWLYLAFEGIKDAFRDNLRPGNEDIDYLPSSVDDAYEKILSKVSTHKDKRMYVIRILQIVVGARRPLTISEMAIALGISTSQEITTLEMMRISENELQGRIRQLCGLFICFSDSRIFLIHQTAKEFLVRTQIGGRAVIPGTWKYCLDPVKVETEMARICVEFLLLKEVEVAGKQIAIRALNPATGEKTFRLPATCGLERFGTYSAEHWAAHVRDGSSFTENWLSTKVLALYGDDDRLVEWWLPIVKNPLRLRDSPRPLETIDYTDDNSGAAMVLAVSFGHKTVVSLLLNRGTDANAQTENGFTALHVAVCYDHYEIAELLVDRGADIHARTEEGFTPLHMASCFARYKIFRLVLNRGADINAQDELGCTALFLVSREGLYRTVELLLNEGGDVNARTKYGLTALHAALFYDRYKIAELLLDRGADINARTNKEGFTPLHTASVYTNHKLVKLLLNRGADVNARTKDSETVLNIASCYARHKVIELLLDRGADVNAQTEHGHTALYRAVQKGHYEAVQLLLDRGADVNAGTKQSRNALCKAAQNGHYDLVKLLLDRGAQVNAQTEGGHTAIHIAAHEHYEIVELLLDRGADVTIQNNERMIALDVASRNGRREIARLLRKRCVVGDSSEQSDSEHGEQSPITPAADNEVGEAQDMVQDSGYGAGQCASAVADMGSQFESTDAQDMVVFEYP